MVPEVSDCKRPSGDEGGRDAEGDCPEVRVGSGKTPTEKKKNREYRSDLLTSLSTTEIGANRNAERQSAYDNERN